MDVTAPGVYHGLPSAEYHAGPGLSHSDLKRLRRTPWHYRAMKLDHDQHAKAPTAQMFNGTLVHCALLEPAEFPDRYRVCDDDKRTKAFKEAATAAQALGYELISSVQRDAAMAQADALRTLPQVAELLASGAPEVSAFWQDPRHNVLCKCRPDWVTPVGFGKGAVLLDVKTTGDASLEQFARSIHNFNYHTQADWYCDGYARATGLEVHGMVFAVVENEYPYVPAAYMLDDVSLRIARQLNTDALESYVRCNQVDTWPGYPDTIQVISLPKWAVAREYA